MNSDVIIVQAPEVGDYVLKNYNLGFLAPFLNEDRSIREVALMVGVQQNALHYHVNKMKTLGLLHKVGEQNKRGKKESLYRAVANKILIPFDKTSYVTLEDFFANAISFGDFLKHAVRDFLNLSEDWGLELSIDDGLDMNVGIVPTEDRFGRAAKVADIFGPNAPAFLGGAEQLALGFEEAKRLQADLYNLLKEYKSLSRPSNYDYLLIVGLTKISK